MKKRRTFPKELVKEYGEQTYRDYKRNNDAFKKYGPCKGNGNFPNTRKTFEDAAWSSVYVAEGCGFISEEEHAAFHAAIVKYAKTTRFPKNFI
jgi:hypothetical protein